MIKKIFFVILATFLLLCCSVDASEQVFLETFDDYEVSEQLKVKDSILVDGKWIYTNVSGNFLNSNSGYVKISDNDSGKCLEFEGASYNNYLYMLRHQYVKYIGDLSFVPDNFEISFDFKNNRSIASNVNGFGIRFMIHNNDKNYYSLFINGKEEKSYVQGAVWALSKCANQQEGGIVEKSDAVVTNVTNDYLESGTVFVRYIDGFIQVTVVGKYYDGRDYKETKVWRDVDGFDVKGKDTTIGFVATCINSTVKVDNVAIKKLDVYKDYEPLTIVYKDVSERKPVNTFDSAVRIGRISSSELANKKETVFFGTDPIEVEFDSEGTWINLEYDNPISVVTLPDSYDYSDLKILVEADSTEEFTIHIKTNESLIYPRIDGNFGNSNFLWSCENIYSDEETSCNPRVNIDNGVLLGVIPGRATITASFENSSVQFNVNVKGEYDSAVELGKIDEYISSKQPVFAAINSAIDEKNANALEAILTSTCETKLDSILDFDMTYINKAIEEGKTNSVANKLLNHEHFSFEKFTDLSILGEAIKVEYLTSKFENQADKSTVLSLLNENAKILELDVDNDFFVTYKDNILDALVNKSFDSYEGFRNYYYEKLIMTSFKNTISYVEMGTLCKQFENQILFSSVLFEANKGSDMYKYLIGNKNAINTVDELKNAIESFKKPAIPPTQTNVASYSGGGGGQSKASSSNANFGFVEINTKNEINNEPNTLSVNNRYVDLESGSWYEDYVLRLSALNIMNGSDNYIYPANNTTRAEFMKMLVLALGYKVELDDEQLQNPFNDIDADKWYYKYALLGSSNDLVVGSDGCFLPDKQVTREEAAVFLDRAVGNTLLPIATDKLSSMFIDQSLISDWAYSSVVKCASYGIFNGYSDNSFKPQNNITRAECAKIITTFIDLAGTKDTIIANQNN